MNKITFLISGDINLLLKNYRPFFKKLEKESIIKIIDVADLKIGKKNKYRNIRYKNISFEYLRIKTFKKFSKFVENNKENLFCLLSLKLEDFFIFYYLKKNKTKLISFDIINSIKFNQSSLTKKNKLLLKIKMIDKFLFLYLFHFKLISNFDYSFLSREIKIKEKSFTQAIKKKFWGKIKKINNQFIYTEKKINNKKRYLVVLDCFFHPEIYLSKNKIERSKESEYFKKLIELLNTLEKKYKKKYIIKPHPKCPINKYEKYFDKNRLYFKKDTYELINQSYLILCSNSSLINYIYSNNINLIYLNWKYLSEYEKNFMKSWKKKYPYDSIDLDTKKIIPSKKKIRTKTLNKNLTYPHTTLLNFLDSLTSK